VIVALALAAAGCGDKPPAGLQGYVEGEYVRVAAPFAGTLISLDTQRGAQVQAGTALFALEAENEDAARREAEERLRKANAQVDDLRKGKRPPKSSPRARSWSRRKWRRGSPSANGAASSISCRRAS
jgi:HlyD family secretion protein